MVKELIEKRSQKYTGRTSDAKGKISYQRKYTERNGSKFKKNCCLSPPRKGYGSIKKPYSKGGALGDRGHRINDLLKRMI